MTFLSLIKKSISGAALVKIFRHSPCDFFNLIHHHQFSSRALHNLSSKATFANFININIIGSIRIHPTEEVSQEIN